MSKIKDLRGQRFGRLTVVSHSHTNKNAYWHCVCDCGSTTTVTGNNLKRLKVISCGCYKKELVSKRSKTHGDTNTPFYWIWGSMISRTTNVNNPRYKDYGQRGITVCERWLDYQNFKADMFEKYTTHIKLHGARDTSIERINNDKGYSPENCKWATALEQNRNTRRNKVCRTD